MFVSETFFLCDSFPQPTVSPNPGSSSGCFSKAALKRQNEFEGVHFGSEVHSPSPQHGQRFTSPTLFPSNSNRESPKPEEDEAQVDVHLHETTVNPIETNSISGLENNHSLKNSNLIINENFYSMSPGPSNQVSMPQYESQIIVSGPEMKPQITLQPPNGVPQQALSLSVTDSVPRNDSVCFTRTGSERRQTPKSFYYNTTNDDMYLPSSMINSMFGNSWKTNNWLHGLFGCLKPLWGVVHYSKNDIYSTRKTRNCSDEWEIPYKDILEQDFIGHGAQGTVFLGKFSSLFLCFCKK